MSLPATQCQGTDMSHSLVIEKEIASPWKNILRFLKTFFSTSQGAPACRQNVLRDPGRLPIQSRTSWPAVISWQPTIPLHRRGNCQLKQRI
jgi:hypothetical protein